MAKTPEVGKTAPDFTLPGVLVTGGEAVRADYTLSAQRGKPVVLAFYPGDNTSVCTKQLCSYTSGLDSFTGLGATVWGISPQDVDSHEGLPASTTSGSRCSPTSGWRSPGSMASASPGPACAGRSS